MHESDGLPNVQFLHSDMGIELRLARRPFTTRASTTFYLPRLGLKPPHGYGCILKRNSQNLACKGCSWGWSKCQNWTGSADFKDLLDSRVYLAFIEVDCSHYSFLFIFRTTWHRCWCCLRQLPGCPSPYPGSSNRAASHSALRTLWWSVVWCRLDVMYAMMSVEYVCMYWFLIYFFILGLGVSY